MERGGFRVVNRFSRRRITLIVAPHPSNPIVIDGPLAKDPVCGMTVDPAKAAGAQEYGGKKWHFCSQHCAEKFRSDPQKYSGENPAAAAPAVEGASYTCPMHPEVVRSAPGACPICGMALDPTVATLDEGKNPELADMGRRLWVSAILTAPILAMAMGEAAVSHILGGRALDVDRISAGDAGGAVGRLAVFRARRGRHSCTAVPICLR